MKLPRIFPRFYYSLSRRFCQLAAGYTKEKILVSNILGYITFYYKKFESIIDASISNNLSNKKIISECIEKIKINITNSGFKKLSDKKIKTYIEIMADIAVDRYREVLINEYIYTQNYKPQYFKNLYTNAEKDLKEILLAKNMTVFKSHAVYFSLPL
ncbi:MAG: hypothetical protein K2N60_00290 [Oscillospiraceae bacterium]|nr:hypothetical protein [Oscillospiraceae bacterium]